MNRGMMDTRKSIAALVATREAHQSMRHAPDLGNIPLAHTLTARNARRVPVPWQIGAMA